tara:strand:+ start:528 stop:875 length:348 start_codon:yes stop_codon:yes gene_type:complete
MKITKRQLRKIIKEEVTSIIENDDDQPEDELNEAWHFMMNLLHEMEGSYGRFEQPSSDSWTSQKTKLGLSPYDLEGFAQDVPTSGNIKEKYLEAYEHYKKSIEKLEAAITKLNEY